MISVLQRVSKTVCLLNPPVVLVVLEQLVLEEELVAAE